MELIRARIQLMEKGGRLRPVKEDEVKVVKEWLKEMSFDNHYSVKVKSITFSKAKSIFSIKYTLPHFGIDVPIKDVDSALANPDPDEDYPIIIKGKKYIVVSDLFPHGL